MKGRKLRKSTWLVFYHHGYPTENDQQEDGKETLTLSTLMVDGFSFNL
jgi:hypothetical protein